jgi:IS1 family transposase
MTISCIFSIFEKQIVVGKKSNQRWLWHAVDHATNTVIAYVFGQVNEVALT